NGDCKIVPYKIREYWRNSVTKWDLLKSHIIGSLTYAWVFIVLAIITFIFKIVALCFITVPVAAATITYAVIVHVYLYKRKWIKNPTLFKIIMYSKLKSFKDLKCVDSCEFYFYGHMVGARVEQSLQQFRATVHG